MKKFLASVFNKENTHIQSWEQEQNHFSAELIDTEMNFNSCDRLEILKTYEERIELVREKMWYGDKSVQNSILDYISGESEIIPLLDQKFVEYSYILGELFSPFSEWTWVDARVFKLMIQENHWYWADEKRILQKAGYHQAFFKWIKQEIKAGRDENLFDKLWPYFKRENITQDQILQLCCVNLYEQTLDKNNKPTSVGRFFLNHYKQTVELMKTITVSPLAHTQLFKLFSLHKTDLFKKKIPSILIDRELINRNTPSDEVEILLEIDRQEYEKYLFQVLERSKSAFAKIKLVYLMIDFFGEKYKDRAFEESWLILKILAEIKRPNNKIGIMKKRIISVGYGIRDYFRWLFKTFGNTAFEMVLHYIKTAYDFDPDVISISAEFLKQDSIEIIKEGLEAALADKSDNYTQRFLKLLLPLDFSNYEDWMWEIAIHESAEVRNGAAEILALSGDKAIEKASSLLCGKKINERDGAARILSYINTEASREVLQNAFKTEKSDDIRDLMIQYVYKRSDVLSKEQIKERITEAGKRKKLDKPVKAWLDESTLPKLYWDDSTELDLHEVRYFLYRQSREKSVEPELEAAPAYKHIDKSKSGDFAFELLQLILANGGICAKNRFALTMAGLLADDRILDFLEENTIKKNNVTSPTVLGLIGSDQAVRTLTRIMRHFKTKYPNVRSSARHALEKIAESRGISYDELTDSALSSFGFEGLTRSLTIDGNPFQVRINGDLKLVYFNEVSNKIQKTLPKSISKELKDDLKELAKELRTSGREYARTLDQYLAVKRKWEKEDWKNSFLCNPLRFAFAPRLVWGVYDEEILKMSFRPTEEGTFVDIENEEISLPEGKIALVHPMELDSTSQLEKWKEHLSDYEISQPLIQLEREVYICTEEDKKKKYLYLFKGCEVPVGSFKSRATSCNWLRGSVVDAGEISEYRKEYGESGLEAFINLENLNVSVYDYNEKTKLKSCYFVKAGTVQKGSYIYDAPGKETDHRLYKLGDVPPLIFSEFMRDLYLISGKNTESENESAND